jgi:L-threonylcarbamoyladenylate synthase
MANVGRAAAAIADGDLVVYPTETVYGLGADALDPTAVERVFAVKGRSRENPLSLAVPAVDEAREYVHASERALAFMRAFLPGPVTVVVERAAAVPDSLTGGREKVGVRIPDHEMAVRFLEAAGQPVTATSANVSGGGSVRRVADLDDRVHNSAVVLDGGETPGSESTVVDVTTGTIHRRGAGADAVREWLADHPA